MRFSIFCFQSDKLKAEDFISDNRKRKTDNYFYIMRLAGVNIPDDKRIDISLSYIYGIGRSNVYPILDQAGVDPAKRAKDLSEEEQGKILKIIEQQKIEGELRAEIKGNIDQLRQISSYRGVRHVRGLPVHGQRTRSNARTKRGKRVTIGAIRKEVAEKMAASAAKK